MILRVETASGEAVDVPQKSRELFQRPVRLNGAARLDRVTPAAYFHSRQPRIHRQSYHDTSTMHIIRNRITRQDLRQRYTTHYTDVVKGVVDLSRRIIALDAEWHADLEALLLHDGSQQKDLWGFNLYPGKTGEEFLRYESLINIRPAARNFDIEISDPALCTRIREVVGSLVEYEEYAVGVREERAAYGGDPSFPSAFGGPAAYPCFKHHRQSTLEKWRTFKPWQRVLMIANEFGRARTFLNSDDIHGLMNCYERALEIFHMTVEAAHVENLSPDIISGLLHLRERTAALLVERKIDPEENQRIREELIGLDPEGYALFQRPHEAAPAGGSRAEHR